jgi:hypothetical protein
MLIMKRLQPFCSAFATVFLVFAFSILAGCPAAAGDHFDGSALAHDAGADIADLFAFLDPTDVTQVVLIATVHPNIVPGQMASEAVFDENIRYRFEIYNDHVNLDSPARDTTASLAAKKAYVAKVKPKLLIDVTFSKRLVGLEPQAATGGGFVPTNLRQPKLQTASLVFQGFTDLAGNRLVNKGKYPAEGAPLLTVTPTVHTPTAPAFTVHDIVVAPGQTVKFFAGIVDDPFFFDVPAFTTYLDSIRNGAPSASAFARARDTFAGYNVLAIAVRVPLVLLRGTNGPIIGVDFLTQRHATEHFTVKGLKASGSFVAVDRMGHPLVNSLLVPFDLRDLYNVSTPKADVSLKFANEITQTLSDLGVLTNPPEPAANTLLDYFVSKGDLLQLDTTISNFGTPAGAGYPNGRRLPDDTVDIFLTRLNHNMTISDSISNSGSLTTSFPFLGKPNQPLPTGSGTDDATRN